MRGFSTAFRIAAAFSILFWTVSIAAEHEPKTEIDVAEPYVVTTIYSDAAGESHFGQYEVAFSLRDFAPPAPPISVSNLGGARGVSFISSPVGWCGDWHPSPIRQIVFCLVGELEVEVSDGEIRKFGPGSAVIVEDTVGKGHVSRVVGEERVYMASVPLEGDTD